MLEFTKFQISLERNLPASRPSRIPRAVEYVPDSWSGCFKFPLTYLPILRILPSTFKEFAMIGYVILGSLKVVALEALAPIICTATER